MEIEAKLERNIRLIAALRASKMFMLSMATVVPFFHSIGMNQGDIYQLQAIFLMTAVVMEVPSGYFADTFGRKQSIVLGHFVGIAGWVLYTFATSYNALIFAEILLGLGVGFISGADDALRYDSLLHLKQTGRNLREDSRSNAFGSLAEGFAGLIGGALALISLRTPIIAQAIWAIIVTPIPLRLVEAPRSERESTSHPWRQAIAVTKYALHGNKAVKWLIFYGAALGTMTYTAVWLLQPYYEEVGVPLAAFGFMWFAKHMFLAFFGFKAEAIRDKLGLRRALFVLPAIGVLTYLLLGFGYSLLVIPTFIGFELIRGVQGPVMRDEINKLIDSDFRATVISVQSLVARFSFAGFALLIGFIADARGTRFTMFASAAIYGVLCAVVLYGLIRNDRNASLLHTRR